MIWFPRVVIALMVVWVVGTSVHSFVVVWAGTHGYDIVR